MTSTLPLDEIRGHLSSINMGGYNREHLGFIGKYYGSYCVFQCKESAGKHLFTVNNVNYLIFFVPEKSYHAIISEFTRLSLMFGIKPEIESFTAVVKDQSYTFNNVGGWFNQNILTKEMCRFLLRHAEYAVQTKPSLQESIRTISDFCEQHYCVDHYLCDERFGSALEPLKNKVTRFLTNLKQNVESTNVNKPSLSYDQGSGFITWLYYNWLKSTI